MTDLNKLLTPLYLSDHETRKIIELIFFSYREFTSGPDKILNILGFGRAHHRIVYFVGKHEKITIKDLLIILRITKQSLSRVLNQLVKEKYILLTSGEDKRTKNLSLTNKGIELEKQLSSIQISKLKDIMKDTDEKDINGFKKLLYKMIDSSSKKIFDNFNS